MKRLSLVSVALLVIVAVVGFCSYQQLIAQQPAAEDNSLVPAGEDPFASDDPTSDDPFGSDAGVESSDDPFSDDGAASDDPFGGDGDASDDPFGGDGDADDRDPFGDDGDAPANPFGGGDPFGGGGNSKPAPAADPFGGGAGAAPADPFGGAPGAAPADPFGDDVPTVDPFGGPPPKAKKTKRRPVAPDPGPGMGPALGPGAGGAAIGGAGMGGPMAGPAPHHIQVFPSITLELSSDARLRIEHALDAKASFDYLDQPLSAVLEDISFHHDIPVVLDARALEEVGIDTGTPITISLKGVSLRSALRMMLHELDLTHSIHNEVLMITTPEAAEQHLQTRFYPVGQLVRSDADGEILVKLIHMHVAPDRWDRSGGAGYVEYVDFLQALVVSQVDDVFPEIDKLLSIVQELHARRVELPGAGKVGAKQQAAPVNVDAALKTKTSFELQSTSLHAATTALARHVASLDATGRSNFEIRIDADALKMSGITRNQRIRELQARDQSIEQILTSLVMQANPIPHIDDPTLDDQRLLWVVTIAPENPFQKIILITTRDDAAAQRYTLPAAFRRDV